MFELAELALRQEEQKPGFSVTLLHVVAGSNFTNTTRLAGALCFKNYLKRKWVVRLSPNPHLNASMLNDVHFLGLRWQPPTSS